MNPKTDNHQTPGAQLPVDSRNGDFQNSSPLIPSNGASTEPVGKNLSTGSESHLPKDGWKSILSTLLLFLLAPVIALSVAAFVIQSYQVDGESMEKTLQDRDRLIVDKLPRTWARITGNAYVPNRGDIIIFNQVGLPQSGLTQQKQLIKRVVALPGERILIKDGSLRVFNSQHPSGFNPDKESGYRIDAQHTPGNVDLIVPEDEVFVCGDNRTNSEDSRYFGPVSAENVVGKLVLRLLPLDKLQTY